MESIAVRNLSFHYPGAASETLRGVDFRMEAGDFAVLIGATGSGKSTLLRLLKPELAPLGTRGGEIHVAGYACYALPSVRGTLSVVDCAPLGVRIEFQVIERQRTARAGHAPLGARGEFGTTGYDCRALLRASSTLIAADSTPVTRRWVHKAH